MAQWIKPCEPDILSSDPQSPHKKIGCECIFNPGMPQPEDETEDKSLPE